MGRGAFSRHNDRTYTTPQGRPASHGLKAEVNWQKLESIQHSTQAKHHSAVGNSRAVTCPHCVMSIHVLGGAVAAVWVDPVWSEVGSSAGIGGRVPSPGWLGGGGCSTTTRTTQALLLLDDKACSLARPENLNRNCRCVANCFQGGVESTRQDQSIRAQTLR